MLRRYIETQASAAPQVNIDRPNSARMWNYWLGGKDHYRVDQWAGDQVAKLVPIVDAALQSRFFLARAIRYLAGDAGIRQFVDIGTGLPTVDNTHELAQQAAPEARTVYVDNDPLVLAHARALLTSEPEDTCAHVDADARDTSRILTGAAQTLDLNRPVGLLMLGLLDHITDDREARETVRGLVAALAPGSHLVIAHPTAELHGDALRKAIDLVGEMGGPPATARTPQQIAEFFQDLDLLEPGVVTCSRWRPIPSPDRAAAVLQYCGVGRKP
ncbi:SAM-dependent methyltransferase [Actinomadura sp. NPDC048955]|uniref:SAM-dependent methyltransferase n=1 Tax=Actinomadura sp. NPDC048955 TaxID=3158228 RepID=UPI0033E61E54